MCRRGDSRTKCLRYTEVKSHWSQTLPHHCKWPIYFREIQGTIWRTVTGCTLNTCTEGLRNLPLTDKIAVTYFPKESIEECFLRQWAVLKCVSSTSGIFNERLQWQSSSILVKLSKLKEGRRQSTAKGYLGFFIVLWVDVLLCMCNCWAPSFLHSNPSIYNALMLHSKLVLREQTSCQALRAACLWRPERSGFWMREMAFTLPELLALKIFWEPDLASIVNNIVQRSKSPQRWERFQNSWNSIWFGVFQTFGQFSDIWRPNEATWTDLQGRHLGDVPTAENIWHPSLPSCFQTAGSKSGHLCLFPNHPLCMISSKDKFVVEKVAGGQRAGGPAPQGGRLRLIRGSFVAYP